jgi:cobalt-zinc-cadmium efflux system membrane fusion protein
MKAFIITLIMAISFMACRQKPEPTEASAATESTPVSDTVLLTAAQLKNAQIAVGRPEQREMHGSIAASGVLDVPPQNLVSVSMPLGGYVKKIALVPGLKVRKGALLAVMEDQQYIQLQQDYLTANSRLTYLEADYTRQQGLNESKASSDKVFQLARADFEAQKILVRSLAEKLRLIGIQPGKLTEGNISRSVTIYSPIDGYVTRVNVNTGKYVNPDDIILEIINPNDLHVKLTIFENDAANLKPGQIITFNTNDRSQKRFNGVVIFLTPNIEDNRSTEVHCHIEGDNPGLISGTSVNAEIEVNNKKVVAVPDDALVTWESKQYIFLSNGGNRFSIFPVEKGMSDEGFTEIKNMLPSSEVVLHNAYTILMKMKNAGE